MQEAWEAWPLPPIVYGSTGGDTLPFDNWHDPLSADDRMRLDAWAQDTWDTLPKCAECGDILPRPRDRYTHEESEGEEFCSSSCAERNWERFMEENTNPLDLLDGAPCNRCGATCNGTEYADTEGDTPVNYCSEYCLTYATDTTDTTEEGNN